MRVGETYITAGGNSFIVVDVHPNLITVETLEASALGTAAVLRKAGDILYIRPKIFQILLENGHYAEAE